MSRFRFRCAKLAVCWLLFAAEWFGANLLAGESARADEAPRPNVILLLLDDAGWKDTGRFGGRMRTPHLDRLADKGMRFTDCHSPAPNCSPSRAGILTGRIPARVGIYSYLPPDHPMHLRDQEITVAELASRNGYRTGLFGKWHLSDLDNDSQPGPGDQGFDYWFATSNNASPSHRNPVNFVRNGEAVGEVSGYSCQIVVDEALAWLSSIGAGGGGGDEHSPFFACLWFHEPHTPIASPPEMVRGYQERYPGISPRRATYLANLENVDDAIGRLLARLDAWGVADETVVWFTSDNGPLDAASRGPLRGVKSNVWEGGHRVPGIVRWPARIAAGSECSVPVSGIDFLPTFCDLAGFDPPADRAIDGESQLPLWEGRESAFRRQVPLYWYFYRLNPALALRDGPWAIVADTDDAARPKAHPLLREDIPFVRSSRPVAFELYRLDRDLSQQRDLSGAEADELRRLRQKLERLHREVTSEGVAWEIPAGYRDDANRRVWDSR